MNQEIRHPIIPIISSILMMMIVAGCDTKKAPEPRMSLEELATQYALAWSSQDPDKLASFYTINGVLQVNGGVPALGRQQIAAKAKTFMTAFPDMKVELVSVEGEGNHATFNWRWTGTNTGPDGNGNSVDITGYERWTLSSNGQLIIESKGFYDEAEYQRQME